MDEVDHAGRQPASARTSHETARRRRACRSAGLKTTVLPQISAGKIFQVGIAIGKFHGVIMPQTPTGCRIEMPDLSGSSQGTVVAEEPPSLPARA